MMKRILVSAIIAAASINAYAESNVTLYGVIDQAVAVTKHKHEAAKVRIDDGIYAGSRFGIKGTEDLGGGTQVFFNLDKAFLADKGSKTFGNEGTAFSREANVGIRGKYGRLRPCRRPFFRLRNVHYPSRLCPLDFLLYRRQRSRRLCDFRQNG